ncbi:TldD/PmbA family protein [Natranaerobius thermophilus]|uniref:Peptidase U62 modulator of DNA gyrase n=1 Tax=Natranaerobius thermophilus (strain ATCC BAA-1301 / DSM 18059 / JW/NM-WN-LF) TaxID=457570 RepID=B2A0X6_NATTJ|nr:TldD/PmbA family protein [Natranaerobius thermophilus]ACB84599.1 peptidase U62 modulator of DNA gyrase [Natranaerobius thermophilus JW/NM-WN-LF]
MDLKFLKDSLLQEDFCDLRYQDFSLTSIKGTNKEIDEVSEIRKSGGNVRVLSGGGFGTFSFTDPKDINFAVKEAKTASDLISGNSELKNVEVNKDHVKINPKIDPRQVSIEDKKALLEKYINIIMEKDNIVDLDSNYFEQFTDTLILNNRGTEVRQEELICGISFKITSKKDNLTQTTRLSLGGSDDYSGLLEQEDIVSAKAQQTVDLLDAEPISGGNYDVILDSDVGGLFIHEAFGHLSEADNLIGNKTLAETMTLGSEFAVEEFNVIDDPTKKGHPGSYIYDHEGIKAKPTYLIKNGKLSGRLHSLESANLMEEELTGHARAKNFGFTPIVRMGNIYIDKDKHSFDEMVKSIDNGLYLFGSAGGQTSGETFTFAVQGGYKIENGEIKGLVRDIALTGHLFTTLKNIEMIGNKVEFSKSGGCGKAGQILIQSGKGSAPIKVKNMGIGGK